MFNRFKILARTLFVILVLNFVVLNFGIEPKEAKANSNTILDISSTRTINYDLKTENNYIIFDFSQYLVEGEKIDTFILKKGSDTITSTSVDQSKRSYKARFFPIDGEKYTINATATIGGESKKLVYEFIYNDFDSKYKIIPSFQGNNIEILFDDDWLNMYNDDDRVTFNFYSGNINIVQNETNTIGEIKKTSKKKVFANKKNNLTPDFGYFIEATIKNRTYKWKLYVNKGKTDIRSSSMKITSGKIIDDNNMDFSILIKDDKVKKIDKIERFLGKTGVTKNDSKKTADFKGESIKLNNDTTIIINKNIDINQYEGKIGLGKLNYFEKLNFKANILSLDTDKINITFDDIDQFMSKDTSKNKIVVYELANDFKKGAKIGEKVTGVVNGLNTIEMGNTILSTTKNYVVEFTFGDKVISTPFVYTPMSIKASEAKRTSVKLTWEYPTGYVPVAGDKIEIFLRDRDNGVFSALANTTFVHGNSNVDLKSKKEAVITKISPNTNYEAKVVLSNTRGGSVVSYVDISTQEFKLTKFIEVKDSLYRDAYYKEAYPRSRNVTIEWDFEPQDMEFSDGDKVEIYIKPNGSGDFSGYPTDARFKNPAFSSSSNLKNTKSADITIPSWMTNFHVDLIYTIGGKKIITRKPPNTQGENAYNRRTVYPTVNVPSLNVSDITQTSAKVTWEYDKNNEGKQKYVPEKGHIIKLHIKKINSMNDATNQFTDQPVFSYEHSDTVDILKHTEYTLTNLEPDQAYRIRITHILQHPNTTQSYPGYDKNYRACEESYNFKTSAFSIKDLKAVQDKSSPNIDLTWRTEGEVTFADTDEVKIYLKESTTSEYPKDPVKTEKITQLKKNMESHAQKDASSSASQQETSTKPAENKTTIELPKYNTTYNVKVEYTIKGKPIVEYALAEAKGEIGLSITDIKCQDSRKRSEESGKWQANINWTYPEEYKERSNDKIKLTVKKHTSLGKSVDTFSDFENQEIDIKQKSIILNNLKNEEEYDVLLKFVNNGTEVYSTSTRFKATSKLQIIGFTVNDIKTKTAKLKWDYSPKEKNFENGDKFEVYMKYNKKEHEKAKVKNDTLQEYTRIYTKTQNNVLQSLNEDHQEIEHSDHKVETGNLKEFKELTLTNLEVNKEYDIKIKYTLTSPSPEAAYKYDEAIYVIKPLDLIVQGGHSEIAEAETSFKTKVDTFKSTVFVSDQTSATFGWEYPLGYEIQPKDKVEIFIKEIGEETTQGKKEKSNITGNYDKSLLTLIHGDGEDSKKINLNEITRVDVAGLTPNKKYKSKIVFTMISGENETKISSEIDITTKPFGIKSFTIDSYQEYDILVKWELENENVKFSPGDKAEIFVKRAKDESYPAEPVYRLTTDPLKDTDKTINNTFSDYVEALTLGEEQTMKLVYTVGGKEYTKELTFNNKISDIDATVTSVNETRAILGITAPDNYEFVEGDKLLVYAKDEFAEGELESPDFLVFEGVQSETLSIPDNMKAIELSYLLPEAKYDVLVALELQDGSVQPKQLEFTTKALPITDISLESIKAKNAVISWNYGDNSVDFFKDDSDYNFTDKLIIAHKESDGTPFKDNVNDLKALKNTEYLGPEIASVKNATIEVEDPSKDYDVAVCYDLGGLLYMKQYKVSYLSSKVDETTITPNTSTISWKYPSNVTLEGGDKTEVFIRKKTETSYPEAPASSSTGSSTTSFNFQGLEGNTEYIAKIQLTKNGLSIDPVEVEFKTKEDIPEEVVVENLDYEVKGTVAEFGIPDAENIKVDVSKQIDLKMGEEAYKGFTVKFNESGTGFVIEPTIPKKKYTNIEVVLPLADGKTYKMVIKEFVTQPENLTQDWLSNAYWFAFERFPDEEGYGYWYKERMLKKTLNGEYFLKNLMFAEDEFTNRNLSDNDLIAALYQIVVNREFDQEGLNFWIGIYNENLKNAQGDKKLAQEVLVDRMVHEQEFGKLCENAGIFWRQSDQDAAGVVG